MSKLRLDLDQLSVETFSVHSDGVESDGTVQGHQYGGIWLPAGGQVGEGSQKGCTVVTCDSWNHETCHLSCGCDSGKHTCQHSCGTGPCLIPSGPELVTDHRRKEK